MTPDAWVTLAVVTGTVILMATERAPAAYLILVAVTVLLAVGVIDPPQAFAGLANPAPVTVAALYVVAAAVEKTGTLDRLPSLLAEGTVNVRVQLARLLIPTAAASSLLNNTPIVAMVAPAVLTWARQTGRSPSRFLIPISFAAILGGLLTLIGTSTNLVVSGLLEAAGEAPLGLFEIGRVGLPVAVVGLLVLVLFGPGLLPDRRAPGHDLSTDAREFILEMVVAAASPLVGRSVGAGGLRQLEGVFLDELERRGRRIAPVAPDEPVEAGDRLTFAGNIARVLDLQRIPGLTSAEERHFPGGGTERRFFEVVVGEDSALAGSTLKAIGFRARYAAAVVAIHRAGHRIDVKLGDVVLHAGDLLVVLADRDFPPRARESQDFLVVAPLSRDPPPRREKQATVAVILGALLLLVGFQLLDIVRASLLAAVAVVTLNVLSTAEARRAIDLNVLLVIAGSFGLGTAITVSGLADQVAAAIIGPFGRWGDTALLLGVLLATCAATELITNNAAAVLMFPIALATAQQAGLDARPFAIAVALGASASFLSPIGYQTNTMVYAMGGYQFTDFIRVGLPLTVATLIVAALSIPIAWPLR